MGLSASSVGLGAADLGRQIEKKRPDDLVVALAGNPNVGKSTVFNTLTGLRQHTGNWPARPSAAPRGVWSGKAGASCWWTCPAPTP